MIMPEPIHGMAVIFDPRNTFVRVFGEDRDNCYNQVVHTLPGDHILTLLLDDPDMDAFKDRLLDGSYPVYHSRFPDDDVLRWYAEEVSELPSRHVPED
jgi:hypothetical protein